ncbi:calmodulin-binding protein 60 C-like [Salvia miltiorrhiza]|uniref:calmodulin-binding protein 60 C-like n=1 Tax=Salvia miltiorrhiza TaxID=226208 RepID=UPI0025AB86FB|nr:calmodulin-binding protein 60 C-like [Salvia miltiorrhiza]
MLTVETGMDNKQINQSMMSMDELMQIVEEELESEKLRIFAKVEEEIESTKRSIRGKFKRYLQDGNRSKMKLELRNGIAPTILTGEEIRGEGDVPIEVALVDDVAGVVVDDEPEASAHVQLFLLKGKPDASQGDDWTAEEFSASIVEGKQPILAGNVALQLHRGVAVVRNVKIRHRASKIKPPEFKLGARVVGDCRVKEAKTEAFTLKDFRAKYYIKHENPFLSDEVSRLVCIRRGGKINGRLHKNKIYTVEDFLIQLLINPQRLMSIVKCPAKKWEAIVKNAKACLSSERMYCYIDPKQKTGVVFNILGDVLGLCWGSYYYSYTSTPSLSEKQKADAEKLLASAYQNWKEVKAFDDLNSLEQHLAGLGPQIASLDDEDVNVIYEAAMQCIHAWPCSPRHDEAESQIVGNSSDSPRRWRKLLCVSKWISVRRRVSPHPKKQRLA